MKKLLIILFIILIIIASAIGIYHSKNQKQISPADNSAALALVLKQTKGIVTVEKEFPAIDNLVGFLVQFKKSPTNQAIIYADKQGRYLLMGDIINPKGQNITIEATSNYIHNSLVNQAYYNLADTHSILQGNRNAKHLIYIMIDPNSPLFPLQYQHVITYIDQGQLAVKWILVSYLKPYADTRAAAILQAKNPVKALALNAKNYNYKSQTGGIKPINMNRVKNKTQKILEDNWNFMQKYKFSGTPVIFMQTYSGKIYVMTGFLMDEMLENVINSVKGPMLASDKD